MADQRSSLEQGLPYLSERQGQLTSEKYRLSYETTNITGVSNEENIAIENYLRQRASTGQLDAIFMLGQFLFERKIYQESYDWLSSICESDVRAKYQVAVMNYDGLGRDQDPVKGVKYMKQIIESDHPHIDLLLPLALYNLGRAYFEGIGIKRSEKIAEDYWILAAKEGKPEGSVKAQTVLGMFYSRPNEHVYDLKKAHFWHQEATGNGSIESQGALGVMYEYGLGVQPDPQSAFMCYKHASSRGNIFATGRLAFLYYRMKLFRSTIETCERIVDIEDVTRVAEKTDCIDRYVNKGLAFACFLYARCLQIGKGILKDDVKSRYYYAKASKHDLDIVAWMKDLAAVGSI